MAHVKVPATVRILAVLGVLAVAGCGGTSPRRIDLGPGTPRAMELAEVPFYPQEALQCGPAALASALNAAGIAATPEGLTPLVYTAARKGSVTPDMLAGARRMGAMAIQLPQQADAVFAEVAAGRPVIVLQNLSLPIYPLWHYAVVVGYDLDRAEVILRSGRNRREVMPLRTFEHTWARGQHWAMLALAPGEVPVTALMSPYIDAVLALERLGNFAAARRAYEAGTARWPRDLTLLMGAGNMAHAMGDRDGAERAFRQAVEAHPDSDAALNNLAHVLAQREAFTEARTLAQRALAQAGPGQAVARRTLDEINQQLQVQSSRSD